ncbi:unnamed protein product, partial [Nesidiocoris tenuis]
MSPSRWRIMLDQLIWLGVGMPRYGTCSIRMLRAPDAIQALDRSKSRGIGRKRR